MVNTKKSYIIAVDSGGTFTDCVVMDNEGIITTGKADSTPQDFSIGVLNSLETVTESLGLTVEEVLEQTRYFFAHGSTVAINALLTRSGVKTGLITTKGFEDTLAMGRVEQKVAGLSEEERFQVYKLNKADPIVPRSLIKGITERVDYAGDEIVALDIEELKEKLAELVAEGVDSIAVCFLWSFMNPYHEKEVKRIINKVYPGIFVSISSELIPVLREYERMSTTAINAHLSPLTSRYLESLHQKLQANGLKRPLLVMQNIGGMVDISEGKDKGVNFLSSGPVGGVLASKILGDLKGYRNVITTDVGGTSFDVSLIVDGELTLSPAPVFSQYTILTPVIDITSLGAGGGSIAWIEERTGLLKVGPQSAGAVPGPVCYDRGGEEPTLTDANVVLGRIDPLSFLGGRLKLNKEKAVAAIKEKIAEPLGMKVEEAAIGVIQILTSHMADLIRKTTIERGYDPSEFVLFSFGGAGPLCPYGPLVTGIRKVVFPAFNSVFSAFGMAGSDIVQVERHSEPMLAPFDPERVNKIYEEIEEKVVSGLTKNNVRREDMTIIRSMDMRYWGQVYEITVSVSPGRLNGEHMPLLIDQFVERYENKYGEGVSYGAAQVEAVTFEVRGTGKLSKPSLVRHDFALTYPAAGFKGQREVFFENEHAFQPTNIYTREKLKPGNVVKGPAVIEAIDTTILVSPVQEVVVDEFLNIIMDL